VRGEDGPPQQRDEQRQVRDEREHADQVEGVERLDEPPHVVEDREEREARLAAPLRLHVHHGERVTDRVREPGRVRREARRRRQSEGDRGRRAPAPRDDGERRHEREPGDPRQPGRERERDRPAVTAAVGEHEEPGDEGEEHALAVGEHERERVRREHEVEERPPRVRRREAVAREHVEPGHPDEHGHVGDGQRRQRVVQAGQPAERADRERVEREERDREAGLVPVVRDPDVVLGVPAGDRRPRLPLPRLENAVPAEVLDEHGAAGDDGHAAREPQADDVDGRRSLGGRAGRPRLRDGVRLRGPGARDAGDRVRPGSHRRKPTDGRRRPPHPGAPGGLCCRLARRPAGGARGEVAEWLKAPAC
jgi:hypothetical protein